MNTFVRQLAVLSIIWSFCELLLPDGKQQKMVRMTVSLLVMAALITAVNGLLGQSTNTLMSIPASSALAQTVDEARYSQTALTAIANQAENICVRIAKNAGYQAAAAVYMKADGSLDHMEISLAKWLEDSSPPLLNEEELISRIADAFETDTSKLWLTTLTDGAMMP